MGSNWKFSSIFNDSVIIIVECALPIAFPLLEQFLATSLMPVGVKVKEMARSEFPIVKQVQGNGAATLNPFPLMVPLWDRLTASPQEGLGGDAGGRAQEKTSDTLQNGDPKQPTGLRTNTNVTIWLRFWKSNWFVLTFLMLIFSGRGRLQNSQVGSHWYHHVPVYLYMCMSIFAYLRLD